MSLLRHLFLCEKVFKDEMYFAFIRSHIIPSNGINGTTMPGELMVMCELGELSSTCPLSSTSSKTSLKSHRGNSNGEVDGITCRVNDITHGQVARILPTPSSYSSPNVVNQQSFNLLSTAIGNSNSDPLLCTSALTSMASVKQHRIGLSIAEDEAAQRCANDASPGEYREVAGGIHSPSSFYLTSKLNLSSNSSSSSSSDNGVSTTFFFHRVFH